MRDHMYIHKEKRFKCGRCGHKFTFQSGLNLHRNLHRRMCHYRCFAANCKRIYKWPQDLLSHIKSHLKVILKCEYCTYSMHERRLLVKHKNVHSIRSKFKYRKFCTSHFKHAMHRYRHEKKCGQVENDRETLYRILLTIG